MNRTRLTIKIALIFRCCVVSKNDNDRFAYNKPVAVDCLVDWLKAHILVTLKTKPTNLQLNALPLINFVVYRLLIVERIVTGKSLTSVTRGTVCIYAEVKETRRDEEARIAAGTSEDGQWDVMIPAWTPAVKRHGQTADVCRQRAKMHADRQLCTKVCDLHYGPAVNTERCYFS